MMKFLSITAFSVFLMVYSTVAVAANQYLPDEDYEQLLEEQKELTSRLLNQLGEHGVTTNTKLRLEYFYFTNQADKAIALKSALTKLGYSSEYSSLEGETNFFYVTGWTSPIRMSEQNAQDWVVSMCEIGKKHDARFDGWGTNPQQ